MDEAFVAAESIDNIVTSDYRTETLVTRLFLSVLCIAGCSRPVEISERPRHAPQKQAEPSVPSTEAREGLRALSAKKGAPNEVASQPFPVCAEGWNRQASPHALVATAAEHCGAGLKTKNGPIEWRLGGAQEVELTSLPAGDSRCIRAIVVIQEPGCSANVSLVEERGRVLARASGSRLILVPEHGPLCIPNGVALLARISSNNADLSGVALILESP